MSTPVSPELVRAIMKPGDELTEEDCRLVTEWLLAGRGHREPPDLFRDHVRAVAAEMRHAAELTLRAGQLGAAKGAVDAAGVADILREFADKLEGIE